MISIKQLFFVLFLIPATNHAEEKTIEQLLNKRIAFDLSELKQLIKESSKRPDPEKIITHYQTILKKKWNILEADFDTALSYNPYGLLFKTLFQLFKKEILEKPFIERQIKKEFSEPLKKFAKKGIWLTDMLTPLNKEQKKIFKKYGIDDHQLERIFLVTHTPDKQIPFEILDEMSTETQYNACHIPNLNEKNKIILVSKDFFKNSLPNQLSILNHEIAHTKQSAIFTYKQFLNTFHCLGMQKNFASIFSELEADIASSLFSLDHVHNDDPETIIDWYQNILASYKLLDLCAIKTTENKYPLQRYEIAKTVIKSLITGIVPDEIPDSWLNNAGQELKSQINAFCTAHDTAHQFNMMDHLINSIMK